MKDVFALEELQLSGQEALMVVVMEYCDLGERWAGGGLALRLGSVLPDGDVQQAGSHAGMCM